MRLLRFQSTHVRNLLSFDIQPHARFNLLLGANGSGKTSVLEAIHLAAMGRSFRTRLPQTIIHYQQQQLTCFAQISHELNQPLSLGIEKTRQGEVRYKLGGETCERLSVYAAQLPILLITPETFSLLVDGPAERRRYLDWGVFHVEHGFGEACQRYQRFLKQRNAILKRYDAQASTVEPWQHELCRLGEQIAALRRVHFERLLPWLEFYLQRLLPEIEMSYRLDRGWPEGVTLEDALVEAWFDDKRLGYTRYGPHRAELAVKHHGLPAHQVLSRGQQKLVICALYLAQARALYESRQKQCVFLLDDIASELDPVNRQRLLGLLAESEYQVFITDAQPIDWQGFCEKQGGKVFHVEHGLVAESVGE